MTTKFPRLYKDRRGKYYFTFHAKKIFVKDLSKADIIRFYNRLVRLHKLKKARKMKKQKRRPRKKQTEEQRNRDRMKMQPWVTSGPAVNPNVHEEEIKKQNEAEKIRKALEEQRRALEEQNKRILQIGYDPEEIEDLGNQVQRLNYNAREGLRRINLLEHSPNVPLTRMTRITSESKEEEKAPEKISEGVEEEEKAPEEISEEEEEVQPSLSSSVPPSQSSSEPPAPLPIIPSIIPFTEEIKSNIDYLGNIGHNKSTGRSILSQISKAMGIKISGKKSGPALKSIIFKREMTPKAIQLINKYMKEYPRPEAQQSASGKAVTSSSTDKPLYDDELNNIMRRYPDYRGTIANDDIKTLLPSIKPQSRVAFIINTDKHNDRGSHWQAVYIDARPGGSQTIEFMDSFGRDPSELVMRDLRLIIDMLKPDSYMKMKINRVVEQYDDTNTCGWHCAKFLIDRFRGKSFAEATGFNPDKKIEGQEDKFENGVKKMKWAYL